MLTVLIFERDQCVRQVISTEVNTLLPTCTTLSTGDLPTAKQLMTRSRPQIVITEAIPTLDCLSPQAIDCHDPGLELITHIRNHPGESTQKTWIIVTMSRMLDDVPDTFRALLGEHGYLFQKPDIVKPLHDHLPLLAQVLDR